MQHDNLDSSKNTNTNILASHEHSSSDKIVEKVGLNMTRSQLAMQRKRLIEDGSDDEEVGLTVGGELAEEDRHGVVTLHQVDHLKTTTQ